MTTNTQLNSIINKLNCNKYKFIIKKHLSNEIDYIIFYQSSDMFCSSDKEEARPKQYFLLKYNGIYVGIIEDLYRDMHVYVQKRFRKKTNLIAELNKTVLPFFFFDRKEKEKRMTFVNEKVENYFLKQLENIFSVGYLEAKVIESNTLFINKMENKFTLEDFIFLKKVVIRFKQIKRKIELLLVSMPEGHWLMKEPFVSDSDFDIIKQEKGNMKKEEFILLKKLINYMKKLVNFYEKKITLIYGEKKAQKFNYFIHTKKTSEIKQTTLNDFENIINQE